MKDKIIEFFKENKALIIILFVFILVIIITHVVICFLESSCYIEYSDDTDDITYDSIEREEEIDNILEVEDFEIEFFDKPKYIGKKISFFASENEVHPRTLVYAGVVISGTIISSGKSLVGYDYYLLEFTSPPYDRIIYSESESLGYVLDTVYGPNTRPFFSFEDAYPETELFQHLTGVKDAFVPDVLKGKKVFKSDSGYEYWYSNIFRFFYNSLDIVDQVGDVNIYYRKVDDEGLHYIRNNDGTYSPLVFLLPFGKRIDKGFAPPGFSLVFITNEGKEIAKDYIYGHDNPCYSPTVYFSRAPLSMFEKIGKFSNGDSVYQKKDRGDESLQSYYDSYVDHELSDDIPEYEVYEKSYPIIYWQDPFGRFLELTNAEWEWRMCF